MAGRRLRQAVKQVRQIHTHTHLHAHSDSMSCDRALFVCVIGAAVRGGVWQRGGGDRRPQ